VRLGQEQAAAAAAAAAQAALQAGRTGAGGSSVSSSSSSGGSGFVAGAAAMAALLQVESLREAVDLMRLPSSVKVLLLGIPTSSTVVRVVLRYYY